MKAKTTASKSSADNPFALLSKAVASDSVKEVETKQDASSMQSKSLLYQFDGHSLHSQYILPSSVGFSQYANTNPFAVVASASSAATGISRNLPPPAPLVLSSVEPVSKNVPGKACMVEEELITLFN